MLIVVVFAVTRPNPPASAKVDASRQIVPAAVTGAATQQQTANTVQDDSGIARGLAWDTGGWPTNDDSSAGTLEHQHVDGSVNYTITPPVGSAVRTTLWMNAGVYR